MFYVLPVRGSESLSSFSTYGLILYRADTVACKCSSLGLPPKIDTNSFEICLHLLVKFNPFTGPPPRPTPASIKLLMYTSFSKDLFVGSHLPNKLSNKVFGGVLSIMSFLTPHDIFLPAALLSEVTLI